MRNAILCIKSVTALVSLVKTLDAVGTNLAKVLNLKRMRNYMVEWVAGVLILPVMVESQVQVVCALLKNYYKVIS